METQVGVEKHKHHKGHHHKGHKGHHMNEPMMVECPGSHHRKKDHHASGFSTCPMEKKRRHLNK